MMMSTRSWKSLREKKLSTAQRRRVAEQVEQELIDMAVETPGGELEVIASFGDKRVRLRSVG